MLEKYINYLKDIKEQILNKEEELLKKFLEKFSDIPEKKITLLLKEKIKNYILEIDKSINNTNTSSVGTKKPSNLEKKYFVSDTRKQSDQRINDAFKKISDIFTDLPNFSEIINFKATK